MSKDFWQSKQAEATAYDIPNGRLWRVYRRIESGSVGRTPEYQDVRQSWTVAEILDLFGVKSRSGSGYYLIQCPNPEHEDRNPSCQVWPDIKAFKCHSCGCKGDLIDLYAYLKSSEADLHG